MGEDNVIWVCGACGTHAPTRRGMNDSSCYLHAVKCWRSSLTLCDDGRAKRANPVCCFDEDGTEHECTDTRVEARP